MFTVAGRMIGHSFLHHGPSFPGLSPAIIHILFGGSLETTPLTIQDCPDLDVRDTVKMVNMKNIWCLNLLPKAIGHLMHWPQHHKNCNQCNYHLFYYIIYVSFQLDGDAELKEFDSIHQFCLLWDLPAPNATNRKWLSEKLLLHAVTSFYLLQLLNSC